MSDAIGPATDRFLVAVAAIGILVVTAPFLMHATVDVPATGASGPEVNLPESEAEDLETGDASHVSSDATDDEGVSTSGDSVDEREVEIDVDASDTGGYLVPGRTVDVIVTVDGARVADAAVEVDGSLAGRTDEDGRVSAGVPGSETVTFQASIPDGPTAERTFSPETDLDVEIVGPVSRDNGTAVHASVEGHDVPGASVVVDGRTVNTTNGDGLASFDVPSGAESLDVRVTRGAAAGDTTMDLDLELDVETFVPAAGSFAEITATYDGRPADVDLYLVRNDASDRVDSVVAANDPSTRATHGQESVRLPASSSVTMIASDGHQTAAVTLQGLFRNLALGIIVSLSAAFGVGLTTLRILRWLDVDVAEPASQSEPSRGSTIGEMIAEFGAAIVSVVVAIASIPAHVSFPRVSAPSLPSLSLPTLSLPSLSVPSLRLPRLSLPSLSLPSLRMPQLTLPDLSLSGLRSGGSEDEAGGSDDSQTVDRPTDPFAAEQPEEVPTMSERELVRAAIRDLGRLSGLHRIETRTPGQIGRRALDRALPREPVDAIVGTVRDVEYAGTDPTSEEATRVKRAVRQLRDAVHDGGGEDA